MKKTPPDERVVYTALQPIFRGQGAQVRRDKAIRKLLTAHRKDPSLELLTREHNLDDICNVAKRLLDAEIFESPLKAKVHFPELFDVSPHQTVERADSELRAAQSEAVAIERASLVGGVILELHVPADDILAGNETLQDTVNSESSSSSLYPVYFPFATQHRLLCKVQALLEQACYDFTLRKRVPLGDGNNWTCAESLELNRWTNSMQKHKMIFDQDELSASNKDIDTLLGSATKLRHTAVHRVPVRASVIEELLINAESLADLLGDSDRRDEIRILRRRFRTALDEVKCNKNMLEARVREIQKRIATQRVDLQRQEQAALSDMVTDDENFLSMVAAKLENPEIVSGGIENSTPTYGESEVVGEEDKEDKEDRLGSNDQDDEFGCSDSEN